MSTPVWITPAGLLGTVTELQSTSTVIQAGGNVSSYSIISGELPTGLRLLADGTIHGTPYSVGLTTRSEFVIRATNSNGVTDRTFFLDTQGPTDPVWLTPSGFLNAGINSQYYTINGQFVDYQLSAIYDALPPGQKLRYFIGDLDGQLPPGLVMSQDGRITGQIRDNLKLKYKADNAGGYDKEPYDEYPYDHVVLTNISRSKPAQFISKTYQFVVSATDGVSTSRRLFKMKVEDPESLRADDTLILSDTLYYLADASYLLSPQWITPANLGYIRASNNQVIELTTYDFGVGLGPVRYSASADVEWRSFADYYIGDAVLYGGKTYLAKVKHNAGATFNASLWELNQLPPHFSLEETSGVLYAYLPYQPAYSISYTFTILAIKTDLQTKNTSVSSRRFTVVIKGNIESTIGFVTESNLGYLIPGRQSELSIIAQHVGTEYTIQYRLVSGKLPTGITLGTDGSLIGSVAYGSQTYFHELSGDKSELILDGGTTIFDRVYRFTVRANDIYDQSAVEQDFYITIAETDLTKYTKIFMEPLLTTDQRDYYTTFINDSYVFDHSLIYRLEDPAFGIQQKIQLYLEHGIEQIKLDNYSDALRKYFYRKKFYFGDVGYCKANDAAGNYVYDLVYVSIIDTLQNKDGQGLLGPQTFSNVTVYPNSVDNMRNELQSIQVKGETLKTDEFLMPRFMRTIQPNTGSPLGFILVVPLCYAKPGNGDTIVKRIAATEFDFKEINFEIDRLIVRDNLTNSGAKYLLFPRRDLIGTNLGEDLSILYGPEPLPLEPIPLYSEDGKPLEVEI